MKILFLDFDGVLNSQKYLAAHGAEGLVIDPDRMKILQNIVKKTDAKIVLTTSWREYWPGTDTGKQMDALFQSYGLQIFDKTPMLGERREKEILAWLKAHPETENFAVLDDRLLGADFLKDHFVKTSNHFDGLEDTDGEAVIRILLRG